jgi:hypothetical protein
MKGDATVRRSSARIRRGSMQMRAPWLSPQKIEVVFAYLVHQIFLWRHLHLALIAKLRFGDDQEGVKNLYTIDLPQSRRGL